MIRSTRPRCFASVGIALLALASACLIGAAFYTNYALSNPEGITYYPSVMFVVRPAIGPAPIFGFVALEHVIVAAGVCCFVKRKPPMAPPQSG